MNSHSRTIACAASLLILAACGGKDSVASKSAAAYREAQAKGVPIGGGHTQHESAATATSAPTDHSAHATMDHSAHAATTDHSAHAATTDRSAHAATTDHSAHAATTDHSAHTSATDHSAHAGTASVDHSAMGHGTASAHAGHSAASAHAGQSAASAPAGHAQHGGGHTATASAGGGHAAHTATASPSASHDQHAPTQHAQHAPATSDPHAGHRATTTTAPPPSTGTISTRIEPASTLRPDAFDAPVAVSVAEAKKTGGTAAHADHGAPVEAASIYACPMHPEVTSSQPGTCPKCGMALVKRTKQ